MPGPGLAGRPARQGKALLADKSIPGVCCRITRKQPTFCTSDKKFLYVGTIFPQAEDQRVTLWCTSRIEDARPLRTETLGG
ncbi:hypothetical protein BZL30_8275 [Mycobacterium kansasii]|uniref:Uncharacterized protein n=1 Tax=Mycobacterium kansasii TaxID=1768 RepID=A0A1V3WI18_MYCKA|nr:hypothetical protein BZL30_8275 [Mycobacterium kansasii]